MMMMMMMMTVGGCWCWWSVVGGVQSERKTDTRRVLLLAPHIRISFFSFNPPTLGWFVLPWALLYTKWWVVLLYQSVVQPTATGREENQVIKQRRRCFHNNTCSCCWWKSLSAAYSEVTARKDHKMSHKAQCPICTTLPSFIWLLSLPLPGPSILPNKLQLNIN